MFQQPSWAARCNQHVMLAMVGLLFASAGPAAAAQTVGHGLCFALYVDGRAEPAATLRIKHLAAEHRRAGFFSVKLLPVLVAHEAKLDIRQSAFAREVLSLLGAHLQRLSHGEAFELRQFEIRIPGEAVPRLTARVARVPLRSSDGSLLLESARWSDGAAARALPGSVRLELRRGQLGWTADGHPMSHELFSSSIADQRTQPLNPP